MWIVITAPFIDKQAEDPDEANVPAGKRMNVTADRGKELIDLGLAEASDTDSAKPAKAEAGNHPIAPGKPGPVDGHLAAEDTTHD